MPSPRRNGRTPLHEVGEAPDYRFTLANERTFLAWVRTALAMMAAGVAVVQFVPGLDLVRHALGIMLILLGGLLAGVSYAHWESNERAMRPGWLIPSPAGGVMRVLRLRLSSRMVAEPGRSPPRAARVGWAC